LSQTKGIPICEMIVQNVRQRLSSSLTYISKIFPPPSEGESSCFPLCPTIAAVYEKCLRKAVCPQRERPRHVYRHHRHRRRRRRRRLTWRNLDSTREHNFNYRSWPHCLRTRPTARQESSRGLALSSRLKFSGRETPFGRATRAEEHKGDFSRAA